VWVIAGPAILTVADLHRRTGYHGGKTAHLGRFTILFGSIALRAALTLTGIGAAGVSIRSVSSFADYLHWSYHTRAAALSLLTVHVSLLHAKDERPPAEALAPGDQLALMMDAESMNLWHDAVWSAPAARLAEWWRLVLRHYDVIAPRPGTAFSPKGTG